MKKLISLLMISCFIFALSACKGAEPASTEKTTETHDHTHVVTTAPQSSEGVTEETSAEENNSQSEVTPDSGETLDKVDSDGIYQTNHINKIDVPCADEINAAQSAEVKIIIYEKYEAEWDTVANRYYNELLKCKGSVPATVNYNTAEQMHEYLKQYKVDQQNVFDGQCDLYEARIEENGGDLGVKLMYAQWRYEAKREQALYYIGVYEELEEFSN